MNNVAGPLVAPCLGQERPLYNVSGPLVVLLPGIRKTPRTFPPTAWRIWWRKRRRVSMKYLLKDRYTRVQ
jgi:hypothetical protein